jgi:hypothetical protein
LGIGGLPNPEFLMTEIRNGEEMRGIKTRGIMKMSGIFSFFVMAMGILILVSSCGEDKVIIKYRDVPPPAQLIFPANDTLIHENNPMFIWHDMSSATRYQLQVSSSDNFIIKSIDVEISDTSYTIINPLSNGSFFWRVRGRNQDEVWGDWSDADIWIFFKTDNVFYISFEGSVSTVGTARDLIVKNDTAFVADGQADLTLIDVTDKGNPSILKNIDTMSDDFAEAIYISPVDTFPYVWVADQDTRVQGLNLQDTLSISNIGIGRFQNVEDVTGAIIDDTLYIFAVSALGTVGGGLSVNQIIFNPFAQSTGYSIPQFPFTADANGVFISGDYVYVAGGVAGLIIFDFTDIYNPQMLPSFDLDGSSLSVFVKDDYAFIAADRSGVFVVNVSDKANPTLVASINTSGRTQDIHVVGDYAFIADASGGLKVIDVSIPDSSHFIAAYDTPYAYGVFADSDYVYICDRDEGLMIFENLVVE